MTGFEIAVVVLLALITLNVMVSTAIIILAIIAAFGEEMNKIKDGKDDENGGV